MNVLLINCDDLGYGDLGCYGSTKNKTPAIDRLANEGMRMTDFYMASPVCTPSRGAMLTGCHPRRIGFSEFGTRSVLFPGDPYGLHPDELTLGKVFKEAGYATGMIGKWHCGDQPEFLPTRHGFDSYFGLPYSNDMGRMTVRPDSPPLPLIANEEVIEEQPDQGGLIERYTAEAVRFLQENRDRPFFLYLAHMHVHLPHLVHPRFEEESQNGVYGAAVAAIDWSTDVLMRELGRLGLNEDTLVIFTSDNGSRARDEGGSNAPLSGTKATNWEGGVRVPCLFRWHGEINPGSTCSEVTSSMDFLPTLASTIDQPLPTDRCIDGMDVSSTLMGNPSAELTSRSLPYYWRNNLEAVRKGPWKLWVARDPAKTPHVLDLFNLEQDPGETINVADQHPDVVSDLQKEAQQYRETLGDALTDSPGTDLRPVGEVENAKPLTSYDPEHPYMVAMYDGPAG